MVLFKLFSFMIYKKGACGLIEIIFFSLCSFLLIFITLLTQHSIRRTYSSSIFKVFFNVIDCDLYISLQLDIHQIWSFFSLGFIFVEYQLTHAMCMMMTMQKTPFQLFAFSSISSQHLEDIQPATYVCRWWVLKMTWRNWTENLVWSKFEFPLYDSVRIQECNSDSFFYFGVLNFFRVFNSIVVVIA